MWAYPYDAYSVVAQNRVPLAQWVVVGEGRTVNNALGLPAIGIYHGENYNFKTVSVIEHSFRIQEKVPVEIREQLRDKQVKYYTMFWGPHMDPPLDKPDNIVLHPVAERWRLPDDWHREVDNDAFNFSVNIPTGIFDWSSNVTVAVGSAISRGALSPINVNYHDRVYFSPDNGRIGLPRDPHEIATFWLLALDPQSNKAIVVFNIIGGSELVALGEKLEFFNWETTLRNMQRIPVNNHSVLDAALNTIRYDFEQNYVHAEEELIFEEREMRNLFNSALDRGDIVFAQDLIYQAIGVGRLEFADDLNLRLGRFVAAQQAEAARVEREQQEREAREARQREEVLEIQREREQREVEEARRRDEVARLERERQERVVREARERQEEQDRILAEQLYREEQEGTGAVVRETEGLIPAEQRARFENEIRQLEIQARSLRDVIRPYENRYGSAALARYSATTPYKKAKTALAPIETRIAALRRDLERSSR
ncbi:MAG: hypothetical protein US13_C0002G0158 [candidate division TM6 bacterium GW2011_GWE2_36_25]|nr:MAG: hypothetical protein US03_C0002G0159 [candidate division TM6 bacterium GW2011_GWF2_36_131]KKQ03592.1 MAG: hypothetical protein US13_C0002G0158 [candidate division TM6 bacterium GW2011_GWE2_36_25]KKQ20131.1 MAG: hypothetical protein US32_C0001G0028 [candidate division TM6 bacterium GW2011_GWA2_36_9]